jgi:hypothetical protein
MARFETDSYFPEPMWGQKQLNDGNVKRLTLDRIDSIVFGFSGNRLSYKMLVLI